MKGAKLLVEVCREVAPNWSNIAKRWVLSIDGGITEPAALRYLLHQRKTEVRVPDAEAMLSRRLRPAHRFHPKTLLLETQSPTIRPRGLLVGSANLTCNGLCFGHEHALVAYLDEGAASASLAAGIEDLAQVVDSATQIDEAFVDRYAAIRPASPELPVEFEGPRSERILQEGAVLPARQAAALAAASNLWVDIEYVVPNRGRGEEGNQIDLMRGTRVFFGFGDAALPKNSPIGSVQLRYHSHLSIRNLRFGNNSMDKLDLPIPGQEGPPSYRNQTLLFSREADGSFRLKLGTSAEIQSWKDRSRKLGTSFVLRGGRAFGVF
jgi:hypothetical protein